MKKLALILLLVGCGSLNKVMMGPQPEPLNIYFTNVEVSEQWIDFDAIVNVNKDTEHITVFIDVTGNGVKWISLPVVNQDIPEDARKKAESSVGIRLPLRVSHDVTLIKFKVQAFRGKPTKDNPLWHKKHEKSNVFELKKVLGL